MPPSKFRVYGLDETYPELGEFSFKIVINPRFNKPGIEYDIKMIDSDRKPMKFDLKRWGRKMNVTFTIDSNVSDGVSTVIVSRASQEVGRLTFWVIK
jgi:hypothetical protein